MNKKIVKFLGWFLFSLFAVLILVSLYGLYDVMHPPRRIPPGTTLIEAKVNFQRIDLLTDDGISLAAWYTPPKNGVVILLAHGYGDNRPEWVYALLAKGDFGVLAWDARAHGESGGEVSTLGYREILDVKAALDFALQQKDVEHVAGWGGSMGGATMIRAAAAIGDISPRPVYIIHGLADEVASPESAQILFDAANDPKFLWLEENATHLGIHLLNPGRYQRRVIRFFEEWLIQPSP